MLMPTKHIKTENALVGVGARILEILDAEKTVSALFFELQETRNEDELPTVQFDWFLLALDFLYTVGAVRYQDGLIRKLNQ